MNMYVHTHTHTLYALYNISVMHKCMHSNCIQYSFCLCPCVHNSFSESGTKTVWHIEINDVMSSCDSLCCISPERFLQGVLWVCVHFTESLYWKELHRDNKSPQRSFILYFRTLWNQTREYFSLFIFFYLFLRCEQWHLIFCRYRGLTLSAPIHGFFYLFIFQDDVCHEF